MVACKDCRHVLNGSRMDPRCYKHPMTLFDAYSGTDIHIGYLPINSVNINGNCPDFTPKEPRNDP